MQWCEWPMNLMSFDWLRWLLSVFQWVIAWLACQMMLISGQSTILLILYVTVLLLMHVVTVWVLLSLFIHSSLFAQKFRQIQREAKEHSWTKRSLNTDIRPWTTNMLIIKLMTMHKTRKINIAYRSSKWWQWCKTDSWWQADCSRDLGLGSCRTGPVCFPTGWRKKPLNQALVSFALLFVQVSSFIAWLFRSLCCVAWLLLCLVSPISASNWLKWLGVLYQSRNRLGRSSLCRAGH